MKGRRAALLAATVFWPAMAFAHTGDGHAGGFLSGLHHPISGLDHVLAMVSVGTLGCTASRSRSVAASRDFSHGDGFRRNAGTHRSATTRSRDRHRGFCVDPRSRRPHGVAAFAVGRGGHRGYLCHLPWSRAWNRTTGWYQRFAIQHGIRCSHRAPARGWNWHRHHSSLDMGAASLTCGRMLCSHGRSRFPMEGNRMTTASLRKILLVVGTVLLLPGTAHAHLASTGLGPFYDGATHFAISPDEFIPALALALLAGLRGPRTGRLALFLLPAAWFLGGIFGLAVPRASQSTALTCISFLILGVLVAMDAPLRSTLVAGLAVDIGAYHRICQWRRHV